MDAAPFTGLPDYPALKTLQARNQWVAWKYEWRNGRDKKPTKPPVSPKSGFGASHSKPETWGTYSQAVDMAMRRNLAGVGFVLAPDDNLCGIDLDGCRDPETGKVDDWAWNIILMGETYAEVSPSGTGIRLFALGKPERTIKSDPARVEIYGELRYLTVTGEHVEGTPVDIREAPGTVRALIERVEGIKREASHASAPVSMLPSSRGGDFFSNVNSAALQNLPAWVTAIFGADARFYPSTGAYRVTSRRLGRDLEEDLSIAPNGIVDFGVADMGDTQQGKRTAIDLCLEYGKGGDAREAAFWLCDQLRRDPVSLGWEEAFDGPGTVEHGRTIAASLHVRRLIEHPDGTLTDEAGEIVEDPVPATSHPANVPSFPPGLVGDIAAWICDTSRRPQPSLALGAAITLVGTAAGRQFVGPTGSAVHLYVLGLAPTGQGKDHAVQQISRILRAANLGQHIGPSEFISMPAVINFLLRSPLSLCPMDEFGDFMNRILHKKASSFERSVAKILRSMWGISFGEYQSPEWAGRQASAIFAPAMSIYGVSTPEQFWRALEGAAVEDGTVNRFLLLGGDGKSADRDPAYGLDVPPAFTTRLRSLYEAGGPMAYAMRNQSDMDPSQNRRDVGWGLGAEDVFCVLKAEVEPLLDDPDVGPFYARTVEMAVRIATIVALGREGPGAAVSPEDMEFGAALARSSAEAMLVGAEDYLSNSEHQSNAQRIRRTIKSRGGRIKRSALVKAMQHSVRARDLNDLLKAMEEAEEIATEKVEPAGGGTTVQWYRLVG